MSEITRREKSESLTLREIEEEKMIAELKDMGMYEEGSTYDHMKDILRVVGESRDMAKKEADNNIIQRAHGSYDFISESTPRTNSLKDLDTFVHNEIPRSSYVYRRTCTSPTKFDDNLSQDSSSPEIFDTKDSVNRHSNSGKDASESLHGSPSIREYVLRSRNCLHDTQNTHVSEAKMNIHQDQSHKTEKWKNDPFFTSIDEKDVPLQQPKRPLAQERMPFRLCKDVWSSEKLDEIVAAVNMHLKEMADLWHRRHRTNLNSEFHWGSPIQVDASKATADKIPLIANRIAQHTMEYKNNEECEQGSKRKASECITDPCSSDNSDNDSLTSVKKKKCLPSISTVKTSNFPEAEQDTMQNTDGQLAEIFSTDLENLQMRSTRYVKKDVASEVAHSYPKRIDLPNPLRKQKPCIKPKPPGDKTLHKNSKSLSLRSRKDEANLSLEDSVDFTEEEIAKVQPGRGNVEIKPLPMKNLLDRLDSQCAMLKQKRIKEEISVQAKLEVEKRKKEAEENEKEEKLMTVFKEYESKQKQKEQLQKIQHEKTEKWNEMLKLKLKAEHLQKVQGASEKKEESTFMDNNRRRFEDHVPTSSREKVDCPICNKSFSTGGIESHAAQCEQYSFDNDDVGEIKCNDTSAEFVCYICPFKTNDPNEYYIHVDECIAHQTSSSEGSLDNAPTSPVRTFQPINQMQSTEIDYKKPFSAVSRTKKRKR